ncbi:MAG TPA: bifunctional polysaccharide deacetylase/glycosyltransferase family 2 protein [Acidimicrobiales bacterium]|jgi:poly-beta-1,6 N-acetyl-D-glucosamine synthase|nr:bifunctional polysaccharide deacetylase/glycosyltransferase family 2 protein [Acidimicrobiales bacterium]
MAVISSGLLVDGYRHRGLRHSGTVPPAPGTQPALAQNDPVLDLKGAAVGAASAPPGKVALTFDDGPDPTWTPRVLALLRRRHVPATFFLVGSRVLAHPELVRQELSQGDEIGSHTFVHADVASLPGWQRSLELSLTQAALASAAGVHTALFRPPFSSEPDAVTPAQLPVWRTIGRQGYLIVLADRDSEDWRRPGVAKILANATPAPGTGAIVMFHDAGGNRSQTLIAVNQLITDLQARGYRFTTVTGLVGLPPTAGDAKISSGLRLQGAMLATAARIGVIAVTLLTWLAWPIGLLMVLRCLVLVFFVRRHRRDPARRRDDPDFRPPVTIVVPAYNEAAGIEACVRSLAGSRYPTVEVIVVNDGSTDATAAIVEGLQLPNVTLISQANAGKSEALNTGIRHASHDIVVTVDGDTSFEPDTLRWLVQPFADPKVGAVSGNTKVGNRRRLLGRWQHIEYVMGFNLDRRLYDVLDCMPTVPGAIGAFRRQVLDEIGGISADTLAEDTDVTMATTRAGWRVVYEERAVAWTEAPASLSELWKQRYRWSYGTMQAMWKHRGAIRDGSPLGRRALPYLSLFQVLLPLLAPAIDLYAVFGLLFFSPGPIVAYWLAFNVLAVALAAYAFQIDHERLGPLWAVPLQQFVYRQLMYLVVIQSAVTAVLGSRLRWHKLERRGDFAAQAPAST